MEEKMETEPAIKPKVSITLEAREKLIAYAKEAGNKEICGFLGGNINPKTLEVLVDDIYLAWQKASYAQCTIKGDTWIKLPEEQRNKIMGYWHSHHTMGAFHSHTDETAHRAEGNGMLDLVENNLNLSITIAFRNDEPEFLVRLDTLYIVFNKLNLNVIIPDEVKESATKKAEVSSSDNNYIWFYGVKISDIVKDLVNVDKIKEEIKERVEFPDYSDSTEIVWTGYKETYKDKEGKLKVEEQIEEKDANLEIEKIMESVYDSDMAESKEVFDEVIEASIKLNNLREEVEAHLNEMEIIAMRGNKVNKKKAKSEIRKCERLITRIDMKSTDLRERLENNGFDSYELYCLDRQPRNCFSQTDFGDHAFQSFKTDSEKVKELMEKTTFNDNDIEVGM